MNWIAYALLGYALAAGIYAAEDLKDILRILLFRKKSDGE